MPGDSFDWNPENTVVPQVDAIAVYTNPKDDIVIRQKNSMGEDDACVVVPKQHVNALVKALKEAAKG